MILLTAVVLELKVRESVGLDKAVDKDVVGPVQLGSGAGLGLLDVADFAIPCGAASKKLMSFELPARSYCVMGRRMSRFGVCATMTIVKSYSERSLRRIFMNSPAVRPFSESRQM